MTTTDFALADGGPEDLPRTLRREREARERAKREEEERKLKATRTHDFAPAAVQPASYPVPRPVGLDATPAVVTRFEVPFFHLMAFCLKAVIAAIPAMVLLGVLLWFAGAALKTAYPQLVQTEVVIRVPR